MQLLTYNSVVLECVRTQELDRTAVFSSDNTTYLFTRWTIDVECVYHGGLTSYQAGDPPGSVEGISPAETDEAIRHALMQPRKKLTILAGDRIFLSTPNITCVTDAQNGPLPQHCRVTRIPGEFKTWVVSFRIVTFINECNGTNPLLSLRWQQAQTYSEDHYAQIVTTATARFRSDELLRQGKGVDDFRRSLFHPIPPYYNRIQVDVAPHEDGCGIDYRLVDKEVPFGLGANSPARRVEGAVTGWYGMTGALRAAGQANQAAMNGAIIAAGNTTAPWNVLPAVAGTVVQTNNTALSALPKYSLWAVCRAWGNRLSTKANLTKLALGIVLARTNHVTRARATQEFRLTHDLNGKFVEAEITLSWGDDLIANLTAAVPASGIIAAAAQGLLNAWGSPSENAIVNLVSPPSEAVLVPGLGGNVGIQDADVVFPAMPYSNGTRTTTLKLITAALQGTCAAPVVPPPTNVFEAQ